MSNGRLENAKRATIKKVKIVSVIVVPVVVLLLVCKFWIYPSIKYNAAITLLSEKKYEEAYDEFLKIKNYKDVEQYLKDFLTVPSKMKMHHKYAGSVVTSNYSYDENGNLTKEVRIERRKYEDYKSTIDYSYDKNDNIIKKIDSDGDQSTYDYIYDEGGNIIKEIWYDSSGNVYLSFDDSYDENGNLIKSIRIDSDGEQDIIDYSYDENGYLVKEAWSDSYVKFYRTFDYSYDENGNLVKKIITSGNLRDRYIYKYSDYQVFYRPGENNTQPLKYEYT